ncbi:hypothetical protein BC943DRAFT_321002 [Umbelopsis sp. AD052]|nr:hypothetical protein BC943DRAFT_321002 [Umbelopsis sp. AD052]
MLLPLCGNLKAIDIRFVRLISQDSVRLLATHCKELVEFSFYTSSIDKEAIEELLLRPPKRLQSLSMKYLSYNVTGTLLEMVSTRPSVPSHDLTSISLFGMVPPSLDALCALSNLLPNIQHLGFIMKVDYSAKELGQALAGFKHLESVHIRRPLFFEARIHPENIERYEQLLIELADLLPNVGHIKCFELAFTRSHHGDSKSVTKTLQMEVK